MEYSIKEVYGRKFGLPAAQVKFFDELTPEQQHIGVARFFSLHNAGAYVYAIKRDGNLVWAREKRDLLMEDNYKQIETSSTDDKKETI